MYRPPQAPAIVLPEGTELANTDVPGSPFGPRGPVSPLSACCAEWLIFFSVTAPFLICEVPTLLAGSWSAAYAPPLSARNRASRDTALAKPKRRPLRELVVWNLVNI